MKMAAVYRVTSFDNRRLGHSSVSCVSSDRGRHMTVIPVQVDRRDK